MRWLSQFLKRVNLPEGLDVAERWPMPATSTIHVVARWPEHTTLRNRGRAWARIDGRWRRLASLDLNIETALGGGRTAILDLSFPNGESQRWKLLMRYYPLTIEDRDDRTMRAGGEGWELKEHHVAAWGD
jgi:hypothetical protein